MDKNRQNRKIHSTSFLKYFTLKIPTMELSDTYIETTIKIWGKSKNMNQEIINAIFDLQSKNKLLEFFDKLIKIYLSIISQKVAITLIRVIYKNANKFSNKGTENLWNSEYDKAQRLLLLLINDKVSKDRIQGVLEETITNTPNLPFAVYVVLACRKERGGPFHNIYDSIKIEKLQNKIADRLKKYFIDENRDIFDELQEERGWAFVLYQWATNWMTFTGDNNKIVNGYVFSLIKDNVKKFIEFLMHQRKRTVSDTWTFDLEELGRVYNLVEFQKLAEKFKDDNSLSKEEKDSIKMFLKLYSKETKTGENQ